MLELSYDIEPDQWDVFDGKALAARMIADAWQLLLPYTDNCAGCADQLFSYIANHELETLHREGATPCVMALSQATQEGKQAHFLSHQELTRELLMKQRAAGGGHCEPQSDPEFP